MTARRQRRDTGVGVREEAEERREQRMLNMMQMFVTSITNAGHKQKRSEDDSNES